MVRADLLTAIVKFGLINDKVCFRHAVENLIADERAIQHNVLANKLEQLLLENNEQHSLSESFISYSGNNNNLFNEIIPRRKLSDLVLPSNVLDICKEIIEEQNRSQILKSYNLDPRNRILMVGPPGNGKTSLAEAIAERLSVPLIVVCYDGIVGSYLGETANNIRKLIDYSKTRRCVLFFDEFETLAKERGDIHETGEIKRVVSSLLLQIDSLPSHVIVIGATNHDELLDKAVYRRFQVKLNLPSPTANGIKMWLEMYEKRSQISLKTPLDSLANKLSKFNMSFSEVEEFCLSISRQYVLSQPNANIKKILNDYLKQLEQQYMNKL